MILCTLRHQCPNKRSPTVCLPVNIHWCMYVIQGPDKYGPSSVGNASLHRAFISKILFSCVCRSYCDLLHETLLKMKPTASSCCRFPDKTSCHKERKGGLVFVSWSWIAMLVTSNSRWEVYSFSSISWFSSLTISLMCLEYSVKATWSFRSCAECLASSRSSWWHSSSNRDQRWRRRLGHVEARKTDL